MGRRALAGELGRVRAAEDGSGKKAGQWAGEGQRGAATRRSLGERRLGCSEPRASWSCGSPVGDHDHTTAWLWLVPPRRRGQPGVSPGPPKRLLSALHPPGAWRAGPFQGARLGSPSFGGLWALRKGAAGWGCAACSDPGWFALRESREERSPPPRPFQSSSSANWERSPAALIGATCPLPATGREPGRQVAGGFRQG